MDRKGIAVAGNMIVDLLYPVRGLPMPGELTTITGNVTRSTGGALCNVAMDLARLDADLPVTALGRVGSDEAGDYVLSRLAACPNICRDHVIRSGVTSYTLVMADELTKQRSFFQQRGANAEFCEADIPWESLNADILHIGYILLLDALDREDDECGTRMARLLRHAQRIGLKTSVDVVTEAGERFGKLVPPALRYTDYCIINEAEAQASTGVRLTDEHGGLMRENLLPALKALRDLGVSSWTVIHSPEGGFGLDANSRYVELPGLRLPEGYIKGSVGAGDAFCSGVLYGAWRGFALREALELGTAAAVCSLSEPGSTEGVPNWQQALSRYRSLR